MTVIIRFCSSLAGKCVILRVEHDFSCEAGTESFLNISLEYEIRSTSLQVVDARSYNFRGLGLGRESYKNVSSKLLTLEGEKSRLVL